MQNRLDFQVGCYILKKPSILQNRTLDHVRQGKRLVRSTVQLLELNQPSNCFAVWNLDAFINTLDSLDKKPLLSSSSRANRHRETHWFDVRHTRAGIASTRWFTFPKVGKHSHNSAKFSTSEKIPPLLMWRIGTSCGRNKRLILQFLESRMSERISPVVDVCVGWR